MDTGIVRQMGDWRIGREPREPWRINRYGYFGISAAIRDHSMLPFQCSAPPSVKVAKMRLDGGWSSARAATRAPANNTPVAGNELSRRKLLYYRNQLQQNPGEIAGGFEIFAPSPWRSTPTAYFDFLTRQCDCLYIAMWFSFLEHLETSLYSMS